MCAKLSRRKFVYALVGFMIGIYTLPLGLLLWPLGLAWFLANESDDGSESDLDPHGREGGISE